MTKLAESIFDPTYLLSDAKLALRARICLAFGMAGFAAMVTLLVLAVRKPPHDEFRSAPALAKPAIALGHVSSASEVGDTGAIQAATGDDPAGLPRGLSRLHGGDRIDLEPQRTGLGEGLPAVINPEKGGDRSTVDASAPARRPWGSQ